jgi:hypothetical protein
LKFSAVAAEILAEGIFILASCFLTASCRFRKGIHENDYPLNNNHRRGDPAWLRWALPGSNAAGDQ